MMDAGDMMERCMDAMGSMMDGGMVGGLLFVILAVLLLIWLISLGVLGVLGVWAYRRLRAQT